MEFEIETRLRGLVGRDPLLVCIFVPNRFDVPDEQSARLVILGPTDVYKASNQNNVAMNSVAEILNNRGIPSDLQEYAGICSSGSGSDVYFEADSAPLFSLGINKRR